MSEEWDANVWTTTVAVEIYVEGEKVKEYDEKPEVTSIIEEIKKIARENGFKRFIVKVNGETVSPTEFAKKYEGADSVKIEIFKADYAG